MGTVPAYGGEIAAAELGTTLIHEHLFVTDRALPHPEWDEEGVVDSAVVLLDRLYQHGVRTVVDLTVPGLGRDVSLVSRVAARTPIHLIAATGYYATEKGASVNDAVGTVSGNIDPLVELFLRDVQIGIDGSRVRAGMIKITSGPAGITPEIARVFTAAAVAHRETGVPITTHSEAATCGGREQQRMLTELGVPLDRVVIGHSGDSTDIAYLRELADNGSLLGFDRFGMEHVARDSDRIRTLLTMLELGYRDQIVLSQDAAVFSHITPPSWRAAAVPNWRMDYLFTDVLAALGRAGVDESDIAAMMTDNPRRILEQTSHGAVTGNRSPNETRLGR